MNKSNSWSRSCATACSTRGPHPNAYAGSFHDRCRVAGQCCSLNSLNAGRRNLIRDFGRKAKDGRRIFAVFRLSSSVKLGSDLAYDCLAAYVDARVGNFDLEQQAAVGLVLKVQAAFEQRHSLA